MVLFKGQQREKGVRDMEEIIVGAELRALVGLDDGPKSSAIPQDNIYLALYEKTTANLFTGGSRETIGDTIVPQYTKYGIEGRWAWTKICSRCQEIK